MISTNNVDVVTNIQNGFLSTYMIKFCRALRKLSGHVNLGQPKQIHCYRHPLHLPLRTGRGHKICASLHVLVMCLC